MTDGRDNEPGKRQRKIQFTNRVQFKKIRHVSEFSEDEIKNGWYNKDDFDRMSDDVSEISKLLEKGVKRRDGEDLCIRGLEHIVEKDLANYRAKKMINSIDAVLDEQEEQWDKGEDEPELIAEIYAKYAKTLAKEAYAIGLRDAEEGYKSFDLSVTSKEHNTRESRRHEVTENEEELFIDRSSSILSQQSLSSSSSSRSFQHGSSSSDSTMHTITVEDKSIEIEKDLSPEAKVNKNTVISKKMLSPKQKFQTKSYTKEDNKNEKKKSSQRKIQPRRSLQDRKNGSELSPFVFRRDGTVMFRKPDVEKLKREQSVNRKNCINDSLSKFLDDDDDDDDDYLAGVLSSKSKKSSVSSR